MEALPSEIDGMGQDEIRLERHLLLLAHNKALEMIRKRVEYLSDTIKQIRESLGVKDPFFQSSEFEKRIKDQNVRDAYFAACGERAGLLLASVLAQSSYTECMCGGMDHSVSWNDSQRALGTQRFNLFLKRAVPGAVEAVV